MYERAPDPPDFRLSLPSLHGLQVFEAAARHLSFTRAAQELCITQTAVSHQVKALESELSVTLFRRLPRRVELTAEGEAWAFALSEIFSRLHAVNRKLRARAPSLRPMVAVSVMPSFCSRWLVPRLGRFLDRHPDVDVKLSASGHLVDFSVEAMDLGIRYGHGRYPGLVTEKLADDAWVVVASPGIAARLRSPRDLGRQVLLQDDSPDAWSRWLAANDLPALPRARRTELTDSAMLIEATVRGQGVGLARWALAFDELASGRLVQPFRALRPLSTGLSYYLVAPRENLRAPAVAAFHAWIRKEARVLALPSRGS